MAKKNKKKIFPKEVLINSLIAAGLVFFGAFTTGHITWQAIIAAIAGAGIACLIRLRAFMDGSLTPTTKQMFNFVG